MNKKQKKFIDELKKEHGLILGFQEYEKEIAILERALTMAVEVKCTFENAFFSTVLGNEDLKLVVPKKEQWYKEQAKKEIDNERSNDKHSTTMG